MIMSTKITRYKQDGDISYALSFNVTLDLLKNRPQFVNIIYISSSFKQDKNSEELYDLANKNNIQIEINDKAFNILSPKINCLVIAQFKKFLSSIDPNDSHIVLVNPSDAGNVGTIIRTAVGFNLPNIAIIEPATDIFAPKTIRSSMGAFFNANFESFKNIEQYRKKFPKHNLYAFMLQAKANIDETSFKQPFSLVFGNEATGLSDNYADFCESLLIPHSKKIDSLSLPIAASIAMYYAGNQSK